MEPPQLASASAALKSNRDFNPEVSHWTVGRAEVYGATAGLRRDCILDLIVQFLEVIQFGFCVWQPLPFQAFVLRIDPSIPNVL